MTQKAKSKSSKKANTAVGLSTLDVVVVALLGVFGLLGAGSLGIQVFLGYNFEPQDALDTIASFGAAIAILLSRRNIALILIGILGLSFAYYVYYNFLTDLGNAWTFFWNVPSLLSIVLEGFPLTLAIAQWYSPLMIPLIAGLFIYQRVANAKPTK
jgi:hypothetical protein